MLVVSSEEFDVFFHDYPWIIKAYEELPLLDKKKIHPSIISPLRIQKFGKASAVSRVFKLNDDWLAKVNRFQHNSPKSQTVKNNYLVTQRLHELLQQPQYMYLQKYVMLPEFSFAYYDGVKDEDVFIRFERLIQGVELSDYVDKPEKRMELQNNQDAFVSAFRVLACVLYRLVDLFYFNHNDLHVNNVMIVKEWSEDGTLKYYPKIFDFDLSTVAGVEPYVHPGILLSVNYPDAQGCGRIWWYSQQKDYSGLLPGRESPSYAIDTAMVFETLQQKLLCNNVPGFPQPLTILSELMVMQSFKFDLRKYVPHALQQERKTNCHL